MSEAHALDELQRALARRISALDSVDAANADDVLAQLRSDRGIPASERMAVYANAYFSRIHDVLRSDFSALHAAIGDDGFHDLARLYLMAHPSRTFSLRFAGVHLPAFLAGPIAEVFTRRWPYAADLAALEWALSDVFDAADAVAIERTELASVPADAWATLRFELVPAHRLLSLGWPVQRIRDAWSAGETIPGIASEPTCILVHRHNEQVFARCITATEARALEGIRNGLDFGALCNEVATATDAEDAASVVVALLERWLAGGLLARAGFSHSRERARP